LRLCFDAFEDWRLSAGCTSDASDAADLGAGDALGAEGAPAVEAAPAGAAAEPVAADAEVSTQASLMELIRRCATATPPREYMKELPVLMYPLTEETLPGVPESVLRLLGSVDQATYPADMLRGCLRGAVLLQCKSTGEPDFYPVPLEAYAPYTTSPLTDSAEDEAMLARVERLAPGLERGRLLKGVKRQTATMLRFSELGFDVAKQATIEAPWGGTQVKPAGTDAYLAFNAKECYIVNSDEGGLPINYKLVVEEHPMSKETASSGARGQGCCNCGGAGT